MGIVEGKVISSFELGVIIDDIEYRHFYINSNGGKFSIIVKPDCSDFIECINELFYKSYNGKYAVVEGEINPKKSRKEDNEIIADSVKFENIS